jgi:hypothetical protein
MKVGIVGLMRALLNGYKVVDWYLLHTSDDANVMVTLETRINGDDCKTITMCAV